MGERGDLRRFLEDLENRIDEDVESGLRRQWEDFLEGRFTGDLFTPKRSHASPTGLEWPSIGINDAIEDYELMALSQLKGVSDALAAGSGHMLCVRCNYGVGILPTLFGTKLFMMDPELNTLPNVWPLEGGLAGIEAALAAGIPDLHGALGGKTMVMGKLFKELMAPYPKVSRHVAIYHPDMQGPMDVCELVWGSGLFMDLMDRPDQVKALLDLIVATYIAFMREWQKIVPPHPTHNVHWGMLHKGVIFLRDDSAMNLSPPMFDEFIRPYDQRLLTELGGGCVHFCGKGDHYIPSLSEMSDLHGINLSQPEYNNMETMFANTVDKGLPILGFGQREVMQEALAKGRDLHGLVNCW